MIKSNTALDNLISYSNGSIYLANKDFFEYYSCYVNRSTNIRMAIRRIKCITIISSK